MAAQLLQYSKDIIVSEQGDPARLQPVCGPALVVVPDEQALRCRNQLWSCKLQQYAESYVLGLHHASTISHASHLCASLGSSA